MSAPKSTVLTVKYYIQHNESEIDNMENLSVNENRMGKVWKKALGNNKSEKPHRGQGQKVHKRAPQGKNINLGGKIKLPKTANNSITKEYYTTL